jgi:octaprenyl-diphosphate synthase
MIVSQEPVQMKHSLEDIRSLVREDIQAQNELIVTALHSPVPLIREIGQYIVSSGGKRIRPLLVLLTAKALSISSQDHIKAAVIVEFIHTATLLHDDIVDHSLLRRGKATAHALWGEEASVLTGDFLYSRAFQLMASLNSLEVMAILADATNKIAEGEVMQLQNIRKIDLSEADYLAVIESKTATLFSAACELTAVLTHQKEHQKSLADFGRHVGIAFQMMDDVLDYTSNEAMLGKHIGDDLAEGKMTLPLIYALKRAPEPEASQIRTMIEMNQHHPADIQKIIKFIKHHHGFAYTVNKIRQEAFKACEALSSLPQTQYKEYLHHLVGLMTHRSS